LYHRKSEYHAVSCGVKLKLLGASEIIRRVLMAQEKAALSKKEFGDRLGVSVDSVARMIKKGKIRIINFGRRILIPASELDRLLRG
jgi:excisionase family DNA binding protein